MKELEGKVGLLKKSLINLKDTAKQRKSAETKKEELSRLITKKKNIWEMHDFYQNNILYSAFES